MYCFHDLGKPMYDGMMVNMNPLLGKLYITLFLEPVSEDLSY